MDDGQKMNTDYTVPALKKGLQILELFSVRQRVLTIGEVAERLEVSLADAQLRIAGDAQLDGVAFSGQWTRDLGPDAARPSRLEADTRLSRAGLARSGSEERAAGRCRRPPRSTA